MISWEPTMVTTNRGTFEVFIAGDGKPICVTHFYSAFTKRGNYFADLFVEIGKVILVNLKECGNSELIVGEKELSMEESIDDLEAIRESLGYETWSFAGHSTGGMLGLLYAATYTDALDKLIVVGAAASNQYMHSKDSMYCKENPKNSRLREIFSILKSTETNQEQKGQAAKEWTEMSLRHPEKWNEYFSRPSSGRTVQRRLDFYNQYLSSYDIRTSLRQIIAPTLVMCGRYDAQCPLSFSEEIHHLIEGSQLEVFEDSNHSPHIEEPERFGHVINHFIMD